MPIFGTKRAQKKLQRAVFWHGDDAVSLLPPN